MARIDHLIDDTEHCGAVARCQRVYGLIEQARRPQSGWERMRGGASAVQDR